MNINELLEKAYNEGRESVIAAMEKEEAKAEDEHGDVVPIPSTFILENPAVHAFMNDPYPEGYGIGTGATHVRKHLVPEVESGTSIAWTEKTNPLVIGANGQVVRLTLDGKSVDYEGGTPIYNLIPQETYKCELLDADGNKIAENDIKMEGTVRMFGLTDTYPIFNTRDLGGYKCNGGHLAYGKLIRGAYIPDGLTYDSENAKMLRDLGVTVELDLRGDSVREDLGWKGYKYSSSAYANILTKPGPLKTELEIIANTLEKGGCVYYHCRSGADRTGTLAAIIQMMCGVSESDIIHEWEMTSFCAWFNLKCIDDEEKNKKEFPTGEMRTFLKKVNAYSGKSYQEKILWWLKSKAKVGSGTISKIQRYLIEAD